MTPDARLRALGAELRAAALGAVEPGRAISRHAVRSGDRLHAAGEVYDLRAYERVFLAAVGKASLPMARALVELLAERVTAGLVITPHGSTVAARALPPRVAVREAGHPLPDRDGVRATHELVGLLGGAIERDLVVVALSGGGSALMTLPPPEIALEELQASTQALLRAGARIDAFNTVRKHLDVVKGGGLARVVRGATVLCLVLSDVLGDELSVIASGPLVGDPSTFADAERVVAELGLGDALPPSVREHLRRGIAGEIAETPKPGDAVFERVRVAIVGNNHDAAAAAARRGREAGFDAAVLSPGLSGEARDAGAYVAGIARSILERGEPLRRPACAVLGGETTVTVRGPGRGGRNQELALGAALALDGLPGVLVASFGTDGVDGPTDAAGALATGDTLARARALGLDARRALDANDSHGFFAHLGDLVRTGPTGTNVCDLVFVLVA